jgi:beta-lactam-binding protein with PASTA domain
MKSSAQGRAVECHACALLRRVLFAITVSTGLTSAASGQQRAPAATQGVSVPDLSGLTPPQAMERLGPLGLRLGRGSCEGAGPSGNRIVRQDPKPKTPVKPETTVTAWLCPPLRAVPLSSESEKPATVPDLLGSDILGAGIALAFAKLALGTTDPPGVTDLHRKIIRQDPLPGTEVPRSTRVNLWFGESIAVKVPAVEQLPLADAQSRIEQAGLHVGSVREENSPQAPGTVTWQRPRAPSTVDSGTRVSLRIARAVPFPMPNVAGHQLNEARQILGDSGLVVAPVVDTPSSQQRGVVVRQAPVAGISVTRGQQASLLVSSGPPLAHVPELRRHTIPEARALLADSGLVLGQSRAEAGTDSGRVLRHEPPAGTRVLRGSAVDLVVSRGPDSVRVPPVAGLSVGDAEQTVTGAGLRVGTRTERPATSLAGRVIGQEPARGTWVARGTAVDLVVSRVPPPPDSVSVPNLRGLEVEAAGSSLVVATQRPILVPDLRGRRLQQADSILRAGGLVTGTVDSSALDTLGGTVVTQTPAPSTATVRGAAVNLVLCCASRVVVPQLRALPRDQAEALLVRIGLAARVRGRTFSRDPAGTVLQQSPSAGSPVARGTLVYLDLARPIPWLPIAAGVGAVVVLAAATLARIRNGNKEKERTKEKEPRLSDYGFRPTSDPGRQTVLPAGQELPGPSFRVTARSDPGTPTLEPAEGLPLIKEEPNAYR